MKPNGRIHQIGVRFTAATANDLVGSILATLNHYSKTCGMRPHDALGCLEMVKHSVLMSMMTAPPDPESEPPPDGPPKEPIVTP